MINKFLIAKHWQVFIIIFVIPMILLLILAETQFNLFSKTDVSSGLYSISELKVFFDFISLFYGVALFFWFWSIYFGLQSKRPSQIKFKKKNFKIFFFIFLIHTTIFYLSFHNLLGVPSYFELTKTSKIFILLPLHLFSAFCILYIFYQTAKVFKTVELQREVRFSDFSNDFYLFLVPPIGIWIIQPKINKMIESEI